MTALTTGGSKLLAMKFYLLYGGEKKSKLFFYFFEISGVIPKRVITKISVLLDALPIKSF